MSVKIGLERGFESLAFEWGHDLRIAQQGEKSCHIFYFATAAMTCQVPLKVQSDVAMFFYNRMFFIS